VLNAVGEVVAPIPPYGETELLTDPIGIIVDLPLVTGGTLLGVNGLGVFLYWVVLEGYGGQSAGKLVLDLQVTDRRGDPIGWGQAAVESAGKAFLLPVDCLVGWFAMEGQKLRLFNRLSSTIVIQTDGSDPPPGVEYEIPEE
jgi:uncharacterized RDD family membrane protein YckC